MVICNIFFTQQLNSFSNNNIFLEGQLQNIYQNQVKIGNDKSNNNKVIYSNRLPEIWNSYYCSKTCSNHNLSDTVKTEHERQKETVPCYKITLFFRLLWKNEEQMSSLSWQSHVCVVWYTNTEQVTRMLVILTRLTRMCFKDHGLKWWALATYLSF